MTQNNSKHRSRATNPVVLFLCNDGDRNNIKNGGLSVEKENIYHHNGIAAIISVSMQRLGAVEIS